MAGLKVFDGSSWNPIGGIISANFTNTATGTYNDAGKNYKYISFVSGSGTLEIDKEGVADILVVGGGGGGYAGDDEQMGGSSGLATYIPQVVIPLGSHSVTVGSGGGTSTDGGPSSLNIGSWNFVAGGGRGARVYGSTQNLIWHGGNGGYGVRFDVSTGFAYPSGAAGTRDGNGLTSSITGTSVLYSPSVSWAAGPAPANTGRGGDGNSNKTGAAGIVVVRVEI